MMNLDNRNTEKAEHCSSAIVWLLTAGVATIGANSLALGPIAPAIARDLTQGVTDTMLAAGSYGIGTGMGALFLSRYVDALGAARALRIALLVLAAAFALCSVTTGLTGLIAAQGLAGLAAGVALPAIYALAALVAPPGRESVVLGRVLVGWTISMVAGVSLSAALADLLHWRAVFAVLWVATLSVWFAIGRVSVSTDRPRRTADTSPLQSIRIPGVPTLLIVCFGYMTAFYATYAYIGGHLTAALQMPVSAGGLVALSYGLGFGVAAFGDHMIDRIGARRVMPYSLLSIAAIYAALGLGADRFVTFVVIAFVWGIANHIGLNLIVAGLSAIDPDRRGAILGINSAVTYFAAAAGAVMFGPVYQYAGFPAVAYGSAGLVAGVLLVALSQKQSRQSDPDHVPEPET